MLLHYCLSSDKEDSYSSLHFFITKLKLLETAHSLVELICNFIFWRENFIMLSSNLKLKDFFFSFPNSLKQALTMDLSIIILILNDVSPLKLFNIFNLHFDKIFKFTASLSLKKEQSHFLSREKWQYSIVVLPKGIDRKFDLEQTESHCS